MSAENTNSLVCIDCNKTFSGPEPARQHYNSAQHRKKVMFSAEGMTGSKSYCDICKIYCDTTIILQAHMNSPRHKNNEDRARRLEVLQEQMGRKSLDDHDGGNAKVMSMEVNTESLNAEDQSKGYPNEAQKLEVSSQPDVIGVGTFQSDNSTADKLVEVNSDIKTYDFDGYRGHCYVCSIQLTSAQHAQQHLSGKRHKKDEARWIARMKQCQNPVSHETATDSVSPKQTDLHISSDTGTASKNEEEPPSGMNPYDFDGLRGYCHVCKIELTSPQHANQHLNGIKHIKRERQWNLQEIQPMRPVFPAMSCNSVETDFMNDKIYEFDGLQGKCFVCNVDFTSEANAKEHLNGKLHRQRVLVQQHEKPHLILNDQTEWHICELCQRSCNSAEHLEKHKQGKAHQKALQKLRGDDSAALVSPSVTTTLPVAVTTKQSIDDLSMAPAPPNITTNQMTWSTWNTKPPLMITANRSGKMPSKFEGTVDDVCIIKAGEPVKLNISSPLSNASMLKITSDSTDSSSTTSKYSAAKVEPSTSNIKFPSANTVTAVGGNIECKASSGEELKSISCSSTSTVSRNSGPGAVSSHKTEINVDSLCDSVNTKLKLNSASDCESMDTEIQKTTSFYSSVKSESAQIPLEHEYIAPDGTTKKIYDFDGSRGQCYICEIELTSVEHATQHLNGQKHAKVLQKLKKGYGHTILSINTDNDFNGGSETRCDICCLQFSGPESAQQHYINEKHKLQLAFSQPAPERDLPEIVKLVDGSTTETTDEINPYDLTDTMPRTYQIELYEKALEGDTICFLPTGTGKTLISCLVVSHMLHLNPHRQVVFLVDRVLLVLQQSRVLQKELGDKEFPRYDDDTKSLVTRKLRIAVLCGGLQHTSGVPLYQQDIIVVTAAYFSNILEKKSVKWSDLCLAVFDETHHCDKDHPFNKLLKHHHLPLDLDKRPKVVGLTASPAGKDTVNRTEDMLWKLLANMGDATLTLVEECLDDFGRYKPSVDLEVKEVSLSAKEETLKEELLQYLMRCYMRISSETNLKVLQKGMPKLNIENLQGEILEELKQMLTVVRANDRNSEELVETLKSHTQIICDALNGLEECGGSFAYDILKPLTFEVTDASFKVAAEKLALPCEKLQDSVEQYQKMLDTLPAGEEPDDLTSAAQHLVIEILQGVEWSKTDLTQDGKKPIVLVLVEERKVARHLTVLLQNKSSLLEKNIKSTYVIGHGKSNKDGMNVKTQEQVLREIKDYRYQVIVATSVAEEGLDLPECELVIQLAPPTTVTALVQIRGRARKPGSRFVALVRDSGQKEKIETLLKREKHMTEATQNVLKKQNPEMSETIPKSV